MKEQQNKRHYQIEGKNLTLGPYCKKYVREYHEWLKNDQELLYLTGSELLTLEEQYENQKSWIEDPHKYTFLIFSKTGKMIGDVNLFFSEWIEPYQAEINIMIAAREERGKGHAREALKLAEAFAFLYYNKSEIIAKIKEDNIGSQKLFTSSGYNFIKYEQRYKQNEYSKKLQGQIEFKGILQGKMKEWTDIHQIMKPE